MYVIRKKNFLDGEVTGFGPYATDQEARLSLANTLEALYDAAPELDCGDRQREIENAVFEGQKKVVDVSGKVVYVYSIIRT